MRTQLIESLVVGTLIGSIVVIARWVVPNEVFIQLGILLIGAGLLIALQRYLVRHAASHLPNQAAPALSEQPAPEPVIAVNTPQTKLHSPHFEWADSADTAAPATPEPPPSESPAEQQTDSRIEKVV